jgi:tRNA(fMet)-specific endonuclease VapC
MSDFVLLDTDVVSYLFKNSGHATRFRSLIEGKRIAISFVTVAELYKWAIHRSWSETRVQSLEVMLSKCVVVRFSSRLAWKWAEISAARQKAGRTIDSMDAWIAATAVHHSISLVTNNVEHFRAAQDLCGLQLAEVR